MPPSPPVHAAAHTETRQRAPRGQRRIDPHCPFGPERPGPTTDQPRLPVGPPQRSIQLSRDECRPTGCSRLVPVRAGARPARLSAGSGLHDCQLSEVTAAEFRAANSLAGADNCGLRAYPSRCARLRRLSRSGRCARPYGPPRAGDDETHADHGGTCRARHRRGVGHRRGDVEWVGPRGRVRCPAGSQRRPRRAGDARYSREPA